MMLFPVYSLRDTFTMIDASPTISYHDFFFRHRRRAMPRSLAIVVDGQEHLMPCSMDIGARW